MRFGALEIINKIFMNLEEIISIINLKKVDDNRFEGQNYHTSWGTVFGGQTLSQSLHAAYQTVPDDRIAHSMHAYFILPGNLDEPVTYEVDKIRNGGSFTTRRVVAFQKNRAIFNMAASFQKKEIGFNHQIKKPNVLTPELLLTDIQQAEDHKDLTPERYNQLKQSHPQVFEFKPVGTHTFLQKENTLPLNHCWFRLKDKIDLPLPFHHQLLAFVSDYQLLATASLPHREEISKTRAYYASLDHALWFHRDFSINDWLLYDMESPSASNSRGFARGSIFKKDGTMVASVAQEGLMRKLVKQ
ncbi:acyl-CoA thioesterase II [Flavobacteriaceae bacterium]|nr:acyl-CoA thioesterase II [Flavobacteriaceae bacterium]MDA9850609.1 acyl-CoA thioesterase II [Flavobacteriaceae bacterium]